jgi:acyl-coenzyme A thioesterase PaaI-like protein
MGIQEPAENRSSLRLSRNTQNCYVCGPLNPTGLHIAFQRDGEQGARGEYTAVREHCGWPGILHGGISFALMDEALAYAIYFQGLFGVTAKAETRFREPIPEGSRVVIRAWVVERRRKLVTAKAEIRLVGGDGRLLAETDATMFLQPAEQPDDPPDEA